MCRDGGKVEGDPGSVMTFKPPNPIRIDMSQFIGHDIERLTLGLVDQDGEAITSMQGEHWSVTVVVELER